MKNNIYPLIDLFAGPGGLGEGFSELVNPYNQERVFKSYVSIERDEFAHRTLLLRHFFRSFPKGQVPDEYYSYIEGKLSKNELIKKHKEKWQKAEESALRISLGDESHRDVQNIINNRLQGHKKWALIGGPPCQAYSLVGRSRMMGDPEFEKDERHFLYKEYLKIIIDHMPPVFVMENVKGLLSAKVNGTSVITRIIKDLRNPGEFFSEIKKNQKYKLYSLTTGFEVIEETDPKSFIVKAEKYGVPQARHRMLILGIRSDLDIVPRKLSGSKAPTVHDVIGNLPKIRSKISRGRDSIDEWKKTLVSVNPDNWLPNEESLPIKNVLLQAQKKVENSILSNTSSIYSKPAVLDKWFFDKRLNQITLHTARSHMVGDLCRYFFAASYAEVMETSPKLMNFPDELLPAHKNVKEGCEGKKFADRFRVQLKGKESTTITSHISKDGHYFIHYDPAQCRSLTVREAARLQTFPDNYYFEGPRTAKYHQVGNAVPPYLACQIAEIVRDVLDRIPDDM